MKKFWTVLALVALALNVSSAQLWAEDVVSDAGTPVVASSSTAEAALENEAMKDDEKLNQPADETKTEAAVAAPAKPAETPVVSEEKKDDATPVVADSTQSEPKVS